MEKGPQAASYRPRWLHVITAVTLVLGCPAQERELAALPARNGTQLSRSGSIPPDALEAWLDALAVAESGNRGRLVHRDRDGQLYYGCLQFQARTFRVYARKFHLLPNGTRSEMMERIYDCAFQKRLAALMIRDDPQNWRHWKTTVEKRVGLPPVETGP